MPGPHRGSVEREKATSLEDAVDDGLGEVVVMEDLPPSGGGLVGREDHRALAAMAVVDHVEEHVCRVGAVGQVTDLIDDEDCRMGVGGERVGETALAKGGRELIDQLGCRREEGVESVLDGAVGKSHGQMGLAPARLALKDQTAALSDEVSRQGGAEEGQAHCGLECEVEVVDRLEEGEAGPSRESSEARLLALGDLLGGQEGEEVPIGPLFPLCPLHEAAPESAGVGQVKPLEQGIELVVAGLHGRRSRDGCGRVGS